MFTICQGKSPTPPTADEGPRVAPRSARGEGGAAAEQHRLPAVPAPSRWPRPVEQTMALRRMEAALKKAVGLVQMCIHVVPGVASGLVQM
ncbi:hypothetical protein DIPPA_19488 [Diplonema papillatum]|nr:hypothetical protein DIPPA_19488 [Diplonema papillatum]